MCQTQAIMVSFVTMLLGNILGAVHYSIPYGEINFWLMGDEVMIACYFVLDIWNYTTINASLREPAY